MRKLYLVVAAATLFATASASAQTYRLTLSGASPKGVW